MGCCSASPYIISILSELSIVLPRWWLSRAVQRNLVQLFGLEEQLTGAYAMNMGGRNTSFFRKVQPKQFRHPDFLLSGRCSTRYWLCGIGGLTVGVRNLKSCCASGVVGMGR